MRLLVAFLVTVIVASYAQATDISGEYFPFPESAWSGGKAADKAFLLINLGRLLSDDDTPRTNARGQLVTVRLIQNGSSVIIKMYDEAGQEVLNTTKPMVQEWYGGRKVSCLKTVGRLGEGVEGGRKSSVVDIIRIFREGERLHVQCESTQTFPRWFWKKEEKYTHRTSYVFVAVHGRNRATGDQADGAKPMGQVLTLDKKADPG